MNTTYTAIAKLFHWGMAFVFAGLIAIGFVMTDMPLSPEKLQYYAWHKWAGVSEYSTLRLGTPARCCHWLKASLIWVMWFCTV
jgi:cytochrome b561